MRAPTCANHAPALSGHLVCVADAAGEAAAPTRPKKAASSTMGCFLGLKTAARPRLPASSTECNVAPSARHEARRSTPKTAFDAAPSRTRSRPRLTRPIPRRRRTAGAELAAAASSTARPVGRSPRLRVPEAAGALVRGARAQILVLVVVNKQAINKTLLCCVRQPEPAEEQRHQPHTLHEPPLPPVPDGKANDVRDKHPIIQVP